MLNTPSKGWTLTPGIRCWEPKVLSMMSSHYEKQEPLPADLIEKIIKRCVTLVPGSSIIHSLLHSRYVNAGLFYLRQLFFGTFDIRVHTDKGIKKSWFPAYFTDCLHRGRRLHEVLERAQRVAFARKEWQIHRGRGELQPSSRWLRRRYIDSSRMIFHIPTDAFQDTTATCTRWCSRQTCTRLCSRPTPSILPAEISIVAAS